MSLPPAGSVELNTLTQINCRVQREVHQKKIGVQKRQHRGIKIDFGCRCYIYALRQYANRTIRNFSQTLLISQSDAHPLCRHGPDNHFHKIVTANLLLHPLIHGLISIFVFRLYFIFSLCKFG